MNPRDTFETYYRSAEVLLRVYRLLESDNGPTRDHAILPRARELIECTRDEELILVLNQLFVGIVRERAELNLAFFRKDSLDLLLRQSVVAGCSALDILVPNLLETYLPDVVRIRQRNFIPNNGEVRDLFRDFRLKLEDIWPLAEETSLNARWDMISRRVLDFCRTKTMTNDAAISASLALLGVDDPWTRIADRAGESATVLREKLKRVVNRRNDIVHRADRAARDPQGQVQAIDFVWAQNHVGAIRTVALACCDLARGKMDELIASAPMPMEIDISG